VKGRHSKLTDGNKIHFVHNFDTKNNPSERERDKKHLILIYLFNFPFLLVEGNFKFEWRWEGWRLKMGEVGEECYS
jgi:hypothetical protein